MLTEALGILDLLPKNSRLLDGDIDNRFQIHFHKALVYLAQKDSQKAKDHFREALNFSENELERAKIALDSKVISKADYTEKEETIENIRKIISELNN